VEVPQGIREKNFSGGGHCKELRRWMRAGVREDYFQKRSRTRNPSCLRLREGRRRSRIGEMVAVCGRGRDATVGNWGE